MAPDPASIPTRRPGGGSSYVVLALVAALVLLGGVFVLGLLAAIAIPNFVQMQLRAKRSEVPANVEAIRTAELAYQAAFEEFVEVSSEREAMRSPPGRDPQDWLGGEDWERLGWAPDDPLRGVYWVELSDDDGFVVYGRCDVDGDGEYAEYRATRDEPARLTSERDLY